ncbi:hypothetical protein SE17_42340, partial [Kouleothrix aurantiaca]
YHREDCGVIVSDTARLDCKYVSGLGGNHTNPYMEDLALTFQQYVPYVTKDNEESASLSVQQTVANANGILLRTPAGQWQSLGTGVAGGIVRCLAFGLDNKLYIGGTFTSVNGVANTAKIAVYDLATGTVAALGTGAAGGDVLTLTRAPNGDILAGGDFTSMGGVANTLRLARWNGSAWAALATGANNTIYALHYTADGVLYVGGVV